MSIYGYMLQDETNTEFVVDLQTRKIKFRYSLGEGVEFEFDLLSECRDDAQETLKEILQEDGIVLGIFDTESEYCNVVMFADLPWEDENGDTIE